MTDNEAGEKARPSVRLDGLAAAVGATKARGPAPVERWNPAYCGAIDIRIAADGTWFYEGTPIKRPALVSLFATVLRKDHDGYVLVTPVERLGISVEDVPFVAVAMVEEAGAIHLVTNLGDEVAVGPVHPLRFETAPDGGIRPYVKIRGALWARLTRSLAIDLVDLAVIEARDGTETLGVRSGGAFFPIGPADGST